jgi:hypothetical protein
VLVTLVAATVLSEATEVAKGAASNNNVTPGVLGFLIVAGMGLALFFLLRSMNRQFRKLPQPPATDGADGADGPGAPGTDVAAGPDGAQPAGRVSPGPPRP